MNMRIGTRLGATFAIVMLLLLVMCATVTLEMSRMNDNTERIVKNYGEKVELANAYKDGVYSIAITTYGLFDESLDAQKSDLENVKSLIATNYSTYNEIKNRLSTPDEQVAFDTLNQARAPYLVVLGAIIQKLAAHDVVGARAAMAGLIPLRTAFVKTETDFIAREKVDMAAAVQASASAYTTARTVVWVLSAFAFAISIVMAVAVTRSIVNPLREVVETTGALARGDLTASVRVPGSDEVGSVGESVNQAIQRMATIVSGVKEASETISVATQEFAEGNADLSRRTETQAASLEETAASMEQLTAAVRQNADNAALANSHASTASEVAQRGGRVVGLVVDTMHEISRSSEKVAEITNVIEGIAFQTNILALNAAVEAARAGDQGRGFAVVAGEVRALAQRSASAAKEIKVLISDSVQRVQKGTTLVEEAGGTIEEVVQSVRRVTGIVGEISTASHEQRTGIEQVNVAMSQMEQVTQQNAALVEQSSAAAHSMAGQAKSLAQAISVFRLGA
jgi:methyl-accepting chemotaxis protein